MSKVAIIGGHGMGDCLMAIQCAEFVRRTGKEYKVIVSARDEVFKPLKHMLGVLHDLIQVDESYASNNNLLNDESLFEFLTKDYEEKYYVIPDLLFNNKHTFDFKKYGTNPQMIRSTRLLDNRTRAVVRPMIYLGLMSTTPGYTYDDILSLARAMAITNPQYEVYLPLVNKWAGKDIKNFDVPANLPSNLKIDVNPDFLKSLDILKEACYFVGTDNGPSHLAYHLGTPRLILDPQYNRVPWIARWREDYLESIPINTSVENIVEIVRLNLKIPQTSLLPRVSILMNPGVDWKQLMYMKEK